MDKKDNFPDKIREMLEKRGYFDLNKEQRQQSHSECLRTLERIPFPKHEDMVHSVRRMRGAE